MNVYNPDNNNQFAKTHTLKQSSHNFSNPMRIWITGASRGIGRALAERALKAGALVAVSGRDRHALESIAPDSPRILTTVFDLRDDKAAQAATAEIDAKWDGLDCVVLNAGDCEYVNPCEREKWEGKENAYSRMMEVNFFGAVLCANAALPLLQKAGGRGLLAAVSSTATLCPLPRASAYGASKAALSYFVRGLEPHFPDVDFCVVSPGFVRTPLTARNDFPMPFLMDAPRAAEIIWRGLAARRKDIVFPKRLSWILRAISALPTPLRRQLWKRMTRQGGS